MSYGPLEGIVWWGEPVKGTVGIILRVPPKGNSTRG